MQGEMNAIAQHPAASQSGSKLDNRRMLAALIDLAVVGVGAAAVMAAAGALGGGGTEVGAPLAGVALCWALYYYFACESGGGQTLGKKLMRLRVVRVDGRAAGMREIAVRTALRVIDTALVGLIAMMVTGERRGRLGDLAAGTMIVSADAPASPAPARAKSPAATAGAMPLGDAPRVAPPVEAHAPPEIRPFEPVVEPAPAPAAPAEPAEAPLAPAAADDAPEAPAAEPVVEPVDAPVVEPVDAPVVESTAEPVVEAAAQPVVEVADAPVVEPVDAPVVGSTDEPVVETAPVVESTEEPVVGPADAPVVDVADAPVVEVAAAPVEEAADAPVVEVADKPVAELSVVEEPVVDIATPSLKELAHDVVAATDAERPAVEPDPVLEAAPVVEPVVRPAPLVEVAGPEDDEVQAPELTVRSVETVSAIDLVMGDDEPAQDPPAGDEPPPRPSVA
jgi:uncharacterized RDD family membrane protein YckC